MKKCTNPNCIHKGKLQDESNFYKDKFIKKDGLKYYCKDCLYTPHPRTKKPHSCDCGEKDPKNFHKGMRYKCKICRRKIERIRTNEKYHKNNRYKNDPEFREREKKRNLERYHKNKLKAK